MMMTQIAPDHFLQWNILKRCDKMCKQFLGIKTRKFHGVNSNGFHVI